MAAHAGPHPAGQAPGYAALTYHDACDDPSLRTDPRSPVRAGEVLVLLLPHPLEYATCRDPETGHALRFRGWVLRPDSGRPVDRSRFIMPNYPTDLYALWRPSGR